MNMGAGTLIGAREVTSRRLGELSHGQVCLQSDCQGVMETGMLIECRHFHNYSAAETKTNHNRSIWNSDLCALTAAPCEGNTFFCHSNMCINNTLVCNGLQNCVYPWDENHCKEKRKTSLLDQLTNTSGTVIGVTSCIVIILIIISVIVQIKQPRKKYVQRKADFDQTVFQEVFEPPHYQLCTLRGPGATADFADVPDDLESYHKLRRSSSKCVHDHHCGSQLSSTKGSRSNLSTRDASVLTEMPPQPVKPLIPPMNRRNILVMKHNYSQDAADACDIDEIEEVPTTSHRLSRHDKAVQRSVSLGFLMTTIT
ncbi:Neuropilin and tolloid-like protein 1 [Galemys pyrenaicus]|uniref:Neuropilin and tolloid-like protein 1 n=1 Tax=Galemys pyrenaicus TaxID=202257 RepID=A0A8J5ZSF1_GALPY|nr:Neuropilin and tolloid-like protein 1 [Galemys pyrenaicus]